MPAGHGVRRMGDSLPEEAVTLAELAEEQGFATHGIVSHLLLLPSHGYAQGFASYDGEGIRSSAESSSAGLTEAAIAWLAERGDERFYWGETPAMQRLRGWLEVFAQGDQPILVLGETGTGKSYLAEHFIHSAARPGGLCEDQVGRLGRRPAEMADACELPHERRDALAEELRGRLRAAHGVRRLSFSQFVVCLADWERGQTPAK